MSARLVAIRSTPVNSSFQRRAAPSTQKEATLVSQRLGRDAQQTPRLKEQQAQEHQALAEDAMYTAKVRKNARSNGENHCGSETNGESMA